MRVVRGASRFHGVMWFAVACSAMAQQGEGPLAVEKEKTPTDRLEEAGLKSDDASLLAFLGRKFDLTDMQAGQIAKWVRQLGDKDYQVRQTATEKLAEVGWLARETLAKAVTEEDPEVQVRAKELLEHLKPAESADGPSQMSLVLAVVAERRLHEAVPLLLQRLSSLDGTELADADRALSACVRAEDAEILRKVATSPELPVGARASVLSALFEIEPNADSELVKACLADESLAIRQVALRSMWRNLNIDDSFVPLLVKLLKDSDANASHWAAEQLARIQDPSTSEMLQGTLRPGMEPGLRATILLALVQMKGSVMTGSLLEMLREPESREIVLQILSHVRAPQAETAVMGTLTDPNSQVRLQACMLLAAYAGPESVLPLCRVVTNDRDPMVRRSAAFALGRLGDDRAIPSLVRLITTDNYPFASLVRESVKVGESGVAEKLEGQQQALRWMLAQEQALTSLFLIQGSRAAEFLHQATSFDEDRLRGRAISLLAEAGDKKAVEFVINGLGDESYFVAAGAVEACRILEDPGIVPPLIAFIGSERNREIPELGSYGGFGQQSYRKALLREEAMKLLNERWPTEALPVLRARLKDKNPSVAASAAKLLGEAGDLSVAADLTELLTRSREGYKAAPAAALCKLKVKTAFRPSLKILQETEDDYLAEAMGEFGRESLLDELEAELKKPDGLRYAALRVLGSSNKPELANAILPLLNEKDGKTCCAAFTALGKLGNTKAVAPLTKKMEELLGERRPHDSQVRVLAWALGQLGDKSVVPSLLAALDRFQSDDFTASCIASGLARLHDERAFEPLVRVAKKHPRAAEALGLLGDKRALPHLQMVASVNTSEIAAAKAIFDLDPIASVEALDGVLRTFRSNFGTPRIKAVKMLAHVGTPQAIASIRYALTDDDFEVRKAARQALASLKLPATAPTTQPGH